jgi:hypothetical protein
VPAKPLLQMAVQLEPAVVFVAQLNAPPSGLAGAVLHTASRKWVNGSQRNRHGQQYHMIEMAHWQPNCQHAERHHVHGHHCAVS